jgi:CubicO group peptidase (beta-lactamase class C family)
MVGRVRWWLPGTTAGGSRICGAVRRVPDKWSRASIVQPYSVSKPFVALCALHLVNQGKLDLDVPVGRYWPRFRAKATVRQVLSHQAGVVAIDEPVSVDAFYDWGQLCGHLERQEPQWEPGTAHGESVLFYGHLVGELVRRIDGRTLGRFLRKEVCGPLGLDFHVGLRHVDLARAVDLTVPVVHSWCHTPEQQAQHLMSDQF